MAYAVNAYAHIGRRIEEKLNMPKGHEVVLHISPISSAGEVDGKQGEPKCEFFVSAPCEIVSFESGSTIASRLAAAFGQSVTSDDEGVWFSIGGVPEKKVPQEAIDMITLHLTASLKNKMP